MSLPDLRGLSDLTKARLVETTMDFHQLQKLDLFTHEELCDIMQKWINFQAQITGENRTVPNCVSYIEYQLLLLKTIQYRALQKGTVNKEAAEWCIVSKVRLLYKDALKEFPDDYSLHVPYVKFCIRIDLRKDIVEWAMNSLRNDITNETIWGMLEDLYMNDTDDVCSVMWDIMPEFSAKFIYEIMHPKDNPENEGVTSPETRFQNSAKKLTDLLNMAFKFVHCSYFHISILDNILDPDMMQQLLSDFNQNVFMWSALAQRLWRVDLKSEPGAQIDTTRSPKTRLEQSVAKYKEGIAFLSPENKSGLWCIFINFLFTVYEDPENAISNHFRLSIIKMHLTDGMPYFSENQFLKWIKLVNNPTECLHISEKAVAILPNSVKLWRERLKYEYCKDDTSNARSLFNVGVGELKQKSLPLWQDMIQYAILSTSGQEVIEELFWEGVRQSYQVSRKLRPMFLEWLTVRKGLKHSRAVYNLLIDIEPHSKEMHAMMAKLEGGIGEDFDCDLAERAHKIACVQFSTDMEVRLNYVRFILSLNSRGFNDLEERLHVVIRQSLDALPRNLHDEFRVQYGEILKSSTLDFGKEV